MKAKKEIEQLIIDSVDHLELGFLDSEELERSIVSASAAIARRVNSNEKRLVEVLQDLFDAVHDWHWGEPSDRAEFGKGNTWEGSANLITASMEQAGRTLRRLKK